MWLHFHFLTSKTQSVATRRNPTNIASMSIPQSQILRNLQGRTLKRCVSPPYLSYGNQYQIEEANLDQLVIICEILPKTNPRKREIMKTSKIEEGFFLVSVHPLQKTYRPNSKTITKRKKGFTLFRISWSFSKTAKYTVYLKLNYTSL